MSVIWEVLDFFVYHVSNEAVTVVHPDGSFFHGAEKTVKCRSNFFLISYWSRVVVKIGF